ncbi:MAG TPA: ABC transporter permease [Vicinamibacterales bacterium]|jgi:putative ABC transport system permease protein|nr:ABC transporter permease [Vicinamibacterales bacterium]
MTTDLRFAFRQLLKSPGFTLLALLTLAIGIGLSSAIFSLIDDLFLRGLPYREQDRVVHLYASAKERDLNEIPLSAPRFMHYRDAQTIFSDFAAENFSAFTLTGLGDPVQVFGGRLTWSYFSLLGVQPIRGRNFLAEEEERADVAVVTERFWRARLGGDPNVIGRSIALDGISHTIVGVLPNQPAAWFGTNAVAEVWTTKPFVIPGFSHDRMMRGTGFLRVLGRLKPGITPEQARGALLSLEQGYATQYPSNIDRTAATLIKTMPDDVTGNLRPAFATLLAAVSLVLLIACSNVANLLLARFSGRRREIALRMSLGASRSSVLRLFLLESLLVSALAGAAGAFLAWRLVPVIPSLASNFLPLERDYDPGLSLPVLGFMTVLSVVTGLAMGMYPAVQGSRADLIDGLKEGARGASGSRRQQRFRTILVGAQVALSVTLLAGAALLITSFVRLTRQDLGFDADHLWIGFITLPQARYVDRDARQRFADRTLTALGNVPGLESASISGDAPLLGGGRTLYARADVEVPPVDKRASAPGHDIAPGYLKTWGIPLMAGRDFDEHDLADGRNVVLISQAGAKKVFPNDNPIGKTLLVTSAGTPAEIVGVTGDVRSQRVADPPAMEFYRPWAQENFPFALITVRSRLELNAVTRLVQSALTTVDPGVAVAQPNTMDAVVAQTLGQARLMMGLLGIFAGVAMVLATVGVYGAVAYTVGQRTGEIGVRMAFGAETRDILRLVIDQGMRPVIAGLAAGIAASLALGRLLASQLYQTSAHSPLLLAATMGTLGLAALVACIVPARRASLVNPVDALRAE